MSVPSQNYIYGLAVLSKRTWSVLWRHIRAFCVCVQCAVQEETVQIHLNCANQCNSIWQHTENSIEAKLNEKLDTLYHKLNKKLDALIKQTHVTHTHTHTNTKNTSTQSRLINLTNATFAKEHIDTLALGPNYALEKDSLLLHGTLHAHTHTHNKPVYAAIILTTFAWTTPPNHKCNFSYVLTLLPEDGSSVSRNMSERFFLQF